MAIALPYLGHGVGLRTVHYSDVLAGTARIDWFEAISENFMVRGGRPLRVLEQARASAPVALHGVSLSLGSVDPLRAEYLDELAALADRVQPAWVSDHLCWGSIGGHYAHDLLPMPYTEEALAHVADRIDRVQARLKRQILIENVSSYLTYAQSAMPEWEFLTEIARRSDCGILLDVNNIYVSASNHGFDPMEYVAGVPPERVGQIHLAGHSDHGTHLLDTHDAPVRSEVWDLYAATLERTGAISTLVEWDEHVPVWAELIAGPSVRGPSSVASWGVMLRLPDLQRALFRRVTHPHEAGHDEGGRLAAEIRDHGPLSGSERLEIYAHMYRARLIDALREDYPRLAALVGPGVFDAVAHEYVEARPSTHPSLRWFGAGLGDFVAARADRTLPAYAADLARLEWARLGVFDAEDAESLDVAGLRRVPVDAWPSLRLRFVPGLEILRVGWPVHRIWEAAQSGHAERWTPADTWLRVWRQGDQVFQAALDEAERTALEHVQAGDDFGTLCAGLASIIPEETVAATAGALVLRWIEDGALRADTGR